MPFETRTMSSAIRFRGGALPHRTAAAERSIPRVSNQTAAPAIVPTAATNAATTPAQFRIGGQRVLPYTKASVSPKITWLITLIRPLYGLPAPPPHGLHGLPAALLG